MEAQVCSRFHCREEHPSLCQEPARSSGEDRWCSRRSCWGPLDTLLKTKCTQRWIHALLHPLLRIHKASKTCLTSRWEVSFKVWKTHSEMVPCCFVTCTFWLLPHPIHLHWLHTLSLTRLWSTRISLRLHPDALLRVTSPSMAHP